MPDVAALCSLHRAHVEHVAYEALDIQLGRFLSIDPYRAAERIVNEQRGGYCYQLNGAFSLLLRSLGYRVGGIAQAFRTGRMPPRPVPAWLTISRLPCMDCPATNARKEFG